MNITAKEAKLKTEMYTTFAYTVIRAQNIIDKAIKKGHYSVEIDIVKGQYNEYISKIIDNKFDFKLLETTPWDMRIEISWYTPNY